VLTHGFVVDEQGRKMSKSLGNTIVPQQIIAESGAEVLRLWVSMVDHRDEVRLGRAVLARTVEAYRKIRNTFGWFRTGDFQPSADTVPLDRQISTALCTASAVARLVEDAYAAYDFQAIFHAVNEFVTVELSAFYADVAKDRLYTLRATSPERRSAQTACYLVADTLTRLLAPILPVTMEEVWRHLPERAERSVHLASFRLGIEGWNDEVLDARWSRLLEVRATVNQALEVSRQNKEIGSALGAHVALSASGTLADLLEGASHDLPMLFITSSVSVTVRSTPLDVVVRKASLDKCPRCWRFVIESAVNPSPCANVRIDRAA
jgi:isoleucyl-tRNA synthetase